MPLLTLSGANNEEEEEEGIVVLSERQWKNGKIFCNIIPSFTNDKGGYIIITCIKQWGVINS